MNNAYEKKYKIIFTKNNLILEDYKAPASSEDISDLLGVKSSVKGLTSIAKFTIKGTELAAKIGFSLVRGIFDDTFDLNDVSRAIERNSLDFVSKTNYDINSLDNQTAAMIRKAGISDEAFTMMMAGIPGVNIISAIGKIDRLKYTSGGSFNSLDPSRIQEPFKALITIMFEQVCPSPKDNKINYSNIDLSDPEISKVVKKTLEFIKENIDSRFKTKFYNIKKADLDSLSKLYSARSRSLQVDSTQFINQLKAVLKKTQDGDQRVYETKQVLSFNNKNILLEDKEQDAILKNRGQYVNVWAGLGQSILDKDKEIFNLIAFYYAKDLKNIESLGVDSIEKLNIFCSQRLFESKNIVSFIESIAESIADDLNKKGDEILRNFSSKYVSKMSKINNLIHDSVKQNIKNEFLENQEKQIESILSGEIGKNESGESIKLDDLDIEEKADIFINLITSLKEQYDKSEYSIEQDKSLAGLIRKNLNKNYISSKFNNILKELEGNSEGALNKAVNGSISKIKRAKKSEGESKSEESEGEDLQSVNTGNNSDQE